MSKLLSTLYAFIALAALFYIWNDNSSAPAPSESSSNQAHPDQSLDRDKLEKRIRALEADVEFERAQSERFEQRISLLEKTRVNDAISPPEPTKSPEAVEDRRRISFNSEAETEQKLIAAHIPLDTIQRIQNKIGENRLAVLNLRDKAIRENWINTLEYSEKMAELSDPVRGIRDDFGDNVYDNYLYASGRNNRVIAQQVYQNSAAATAGIQPGDIILNYANTKIFSMNDLRQTTVLGESGETVLVELLRDGEPITTTVPRGPLGISMNVTIQPPK